MLIIAPVISTPTPKAASVRVRWVCAASQNLRGSPLFGSDGAQMCPKVPDTSAPFPGRLTGLCIVRALFHPTSHGRLELGRRTAVGRAEFFYLVYRLSTQARGHTRNPCWPPDDRILSFLRRFCANKPSPSLTERLAWGDIFFLIFPGPRAALLPSGSLVSPVQLVDQ